MGLPSVPVGTALAVVGLANALFMPEEAAQQTRVYMSTATSNVWGTHTQSVQGSLALLANTLVKYQPVVIYVSPGDKSFMQSQLNSSVQVVDFQVDDLWMRDTSCIFAYNCSNYTECVATYGQPVDHAWPSAPLSLYPPWELLFKFFHKPKRILNILLLSFL